MEYMLRFAHYTVFYMLIPLLLLLTWLRYRYAPGIRYRYPLADTINARGLGSVHPHKKIVAGIRFAALALMIFLIAKPQLVDPRSTIKIEGIDIVLVMDVSGSMTNPHYGDDNRTRLAVAKQEAKRFVDKRTNDAMGLVIFAEDTLSRCPLTADAGVLKQMIDELEVGIIPYKGTVLAKAIITAANRLKQSKAKSKIMILLTDGEPSEHDIDPQKAIEVAKKLGIKIYTVGIGDDESMLVEHPFFGAIGMRPALNKSLLTTIAQATGGKFFEAKNAHDMRAIYDTIDRLEKTKIETPIFGNVYDWFMPILWTVFALLMIEILLSSVVWFSV